MVMVMVMVMTNTLHSCDMTPRLAYFILQSFSFILQCTMTWPALHECISVSDVGNNLLCQLVSAHLQSAVDTSSWKSADAEL